MRISERLQIAWKAMTIRFPAQGGRSIGGSLGSQWLQGLLPGTRRNYAAKVGDRWRSSAVAIALNWICNSFPEARLRVRVVNEDSETILPEHGLMQLIKKPNPFYSMRALWFGTLISFLCDGNAYWLKIKTSRLGVQELWYLPHFFVTPQWDEEGTEFITRYAYTVNGKTTYYQPEEMVHFRHGIDPRNMRMGMSPLAAQDRQIVGDNEASTYHAALLEQMGVPGLIISSASPETEFDKGQVEDMKKQIAAKTTGDERFQPFAIPVPIKVDMLGFSPEQMALDKLVNLPVERVFGALNLDPMVAGQSSQSKTYSNYQEAKRAAWENCIIPTMAMFCEEIDRSLLPDFSTRPNEETFFDTSKVKALQENQDDLYKRLVQACGGSILTPNEARQAIGYLPLVSTDETDYDVLREKSAPLAPDNEENPPVKMKLAA